MNLSLQRLHTGHRSRSGCACGARKTLFNLCADAHKRVTARTKHTHNTVTDATPSRRSIPTLSSLQRSSAESALPRAPHHASASLVARLVHSQGDGGEESGDGVLAGLQVSLHLAGEVLRELRAE